MVLAMAYFVLESRKGGKPVSHHEVTRMINTDEGLLVDVRDASEFGGGHINGAVNIPHGSMATRYVELEKYRDKKQIIVVDKMGQHAGSSGKILRDHGFNVVRLQGGMSEWLNQNLPVVKA